MVRGHSRSLKLVPFESMNTVRFPIRILSVTDWLVHEMQQVEDYLQDDCIMYIHCLHDAHTVDTFNAIRFFSESRLVTSSTIINIRLSTLTAVNVLPDSSTGQPACRSADSHVVIRVSFIAMV